MDRCPKCPNKRHCVPANGPESSRLCFIGEAPGWEEDKKLIPFQGKTGQEVNRHYLPLAGLSRPNVWFWNAIGCMPATTGGKLDPKRTADLELLESCSNFHMFPALRRIRPKIVVPMGSFANRAIDPEINLEFQHGIPIETEWGSTFPMYHPSLGIHEPKKMLMIRNDWIRLGKYLKGKLNIPVDEYEGQEDYREIETEEELHYILDGNEDQVMACDTENRKDRSPFCLTFSITVGTGYLIQAHRSDLLQVYQEFLDRWTGWILWHNWLHDYEIVTAMGLRFPRKLIRDTMLMVFHLGNLPQGLKALAYRELGMTMQDFDDLVKPYSTQLAVNYLRRAYCEDWPKPEQSLQRGKDGKWKITKPHGFSQKLKRFFTDYDKDPEKDVFNMWSDNWEAEQEMVEKVMGDWPGKCISHTPFDKIISYATRDADALLRLWPVIRHMASRVRKSPQERWKEIAA